jgi:hypothetical protein
MCRSLIKSIIFNSIIYLVILLFSSAVYAQDAIHIGLVNSVVNEVVTHTSAGESKVKINDKLFFKQAIITGQNSSLTASLRDGSIFAIAPQSVVILQEFIFNPSENVLKKTVNVIKGSFRYISGFPSQNSVTKIITPFGIADIRGSAVQGTVNPKGGLTVNVASGVLDFETIDGRKVTVQEGETLSLSASCDALPTPPEAVATSMQYMAEVFSVSASPSLTNEQLSDYAKANNMPAEQQKKLYADTKDIAVNTQDSELALMNNKVTGDTQTVIAKLIQDMQNKNNTQLDNATRDVTTMLVTSGVSSDKMAEIAINAVTGAKSEHKIYVATTILNTLLTAKPELLNALAPKVQQALPIEQQPALPLLLPNVQFPPLAHS